MPIFKYHAYDQHGGKLQGEFEADSKQAAIKQLTDQQLLVSDIQEKLVVEGLSLGLVSKKVSLQQLEYLTSELSLLLKNGVKIDKGIAIIQQNNRGGAIGPLLDFLLTSIRRGDLLSEAMSQKSDVFSPLYISLVKLGEATGNLSLVFQQLSQDLSFQRELNAKILQALTYPAIIFSVCVLCIAFVFNYIVPQMSGLFAGIEELPDYTLVLLATSDWFVKYQWFIVAGICLTVFSVIKYHSHPIFKVRLSRLSLKLPFVNSMVMLAEQIRFNSALTMMTEAGVAIDKAISLSIQSLKNNELQQEMRVAEQKIRSGSKLSVALTVSHLYPQFSLSLLEVGEESGDLTPVFSELSKRAKHQFENAMTRFTSVLEPLLILFMGGVVGSVVVTMLLSIVAVNDVGF